MSARPKVGKLLRMAAAVMAGLLLAACSDAPEEVMNPGPSAADNDASFPVAIDHAFGETTVSESPKRIAVADFGSEDVVLALGFVPVGVLDAQEAEAANGLTPWMDAAITSMGKTAGKPDSGADVVTYPVDSSELADEIRELDPDIIFATSLLLKQERYDKLKKVAPTVARPNGEEMSWQEHAELAGAALGLDEEARELVGTTEASIRSTADEYPELANATFAYVSVEADGSVSVLSSGDPRVDVLTDLGMRLNADVSDFVGPATTQRHITTEPDSDDDEAEAEPKLIKDIKPKDLKMLENAGLIIAQFDDVDVQEAAEANKAFKKLPAVKNKAYLGIADPQVNRALAKPTVLSVPWVLDVLVPEVAVAADKADKS